MHPYRLPLLVFVFCFALSPHVYAQGSNLGEILIEAEADDTASGAPSSFTTVIKPEALKTQFRDLTEVVSRTVGVNVQETGGLGQFSTMTIRGSTPEQVAVYMDGIRLNTGATGTVDLSSIPIDIIDRIEIIRGGGTAQFGQDAIGGVINIITKHAKRGEQAAVYAGGGYFQTFKGGGSVAKQTKTKSGLLSFSHFMTKGDYHFKAAATTLTGTPTGVSGQVFDRIHNRSLSDSLLAKGDTLIGDHWFLQGSNNFFWTTRQMPGTEEQTTLLYPGNPLDAQERYWRNLTTVQATCSGCGAEHLFFQPAGNFQYEFRHFRDASPAVGSPIDHTVNYLAVNPNFTTGYSWNGAGDHETKIRADYRLERQTDSVGNSTTVPIGTQHRNVGMVMLQDEWHTPHNYFVILPVIRYETATHYRHNTGLKLGVAANAARWVTFKSNIEYGYRIPNFSELYFPNEGFLRGNPNLDKEKSLNFDVGMKIHSDRGFAEVAYFFNQVYNSIIFVPISALTIAPINTFKVHIHGIEASGKLKFAKLFLLEGNYTWTNARFASTGNQLAGRPIQLGNVRLTYDQKWGKEWALSVYSDVQMISRIPVNVQNTVFISSKTQVDAGIVGTLWKNWSVIVEGKNLANIQLYDVRAFPLPRRSFFATLKYDWAREPKT